MGSLLSTVADQKLSLGVSGNAAVSIEGLIVVQSASDASSMREGSRHPRAPSIVAHAHVRLASSHIAAAAPPPGDAGGDAVGSLIVSHAAASTSAATIAPCWSHFDRIATRSLRARPDRVNRVAAASRGPPDRKGFLAGAKGWYTP